MSEQAIEANIDLAFLRGILLEAGIALGPRGQMTVW